MCFSKRGFLFLLWPSSILSVVPGSSQAAPAVAGAQRRRHHCEAVKAVKPVVAVQVGPPFSFLTSNQ